MRYLVLILVQPMAPDGACTLDTAAFQCLLLIISGLLWTAALHYHRHYQVTGGRGGCRTDVVQRGDAAEGWHGGWVYIG